MLNIVLFQPEIPANTGNIIRLCANTGFNLHIIEPAAFSLDDKKLMRAGLDYHEFVNIVKHHNLEECLEYFKGHNIYACTTKGHAYPNLCQFKEGDVLIFGKETKGLPDSFTDTLDLDHKVRIPMVPNSRCMNLSNSVAIFIYEAWRQLDFIGAKIQ
ncbi:MAG: tRNA (uridine(34)/cytosine(34)/5-carboxymethylaminomethyluridine(34)-2'-O)-methyltransferase TrmL [Succinivibrionaceae bacterium]